MKKKKILVAGTTVGVMLIAAFVISSIRLYLIEKEMPPMQDIYFMEYEADKRDTIIYQYDAQKEVTTEVGCVQGFFSECKVDRDKDCIIGILEYLPPDDLNAEAEYSVVKYWLKEERLETCVSAETITGLSEGRLTLYGNAGIYNEGKDVLLVYRLENGTEYILYNIETGEYRYVAGKDYGENVLIEDSDYEFRFLSDNKEKCAYFKVGDYQRLYLYDVKSGKSQCIISTALTRYIYLWEDVGWDGSGEYLFYIRRFSGLFGTQKDAMVYNLRTKKSYSVHKIQNYRNNYAFVRNVD